MFCFAIAIVNRRRGSVMEKRGRGERRGRKGAFRKEKKEIEMEMKERETEKENEKE